MATAIQSRTSNSSSTADGLDCQLNPEVLNADAYRSPRIEAYDVFAGKNAINLEDCQCASPGMIFEITSCWIAEYASPCTGAVGGRVAAKYPGFSAEMTA